MRISDWSSDVCSSDLETLSKVLVLKRTGHDVGFDPARDVWWHELVGQQSERCEPEWVEAEHPLFLLYTSGSTGKPKGIQHSSAGYLLGAVTSCQWVRSEEHTSELQSLMRISYAVFCLKKKYTEINNHKTHHYTSNYTKLNI